LAALFRKIWKSRTMRVLLSAVAIVGLLRLIEIITEKISDAAAHLLVGHIPLLKDSEGAVAWLIREAFRTIEPVLTFVGDLENWLWHIVSVLFISSAGISIAGDTIALLVSGIVLVLHLTFFVFLAYLVVEPLLPAR
jgi:hypothetical protein